LAKEYSFFPFLKIPFHKFIKDFKEDRTSKPVLNPEAFYIVHRES